MAIKSLIKFNVPLIFASAVLSILIILLIVDKNKKPSNQNLADQCLICHDKVQSMSKAHPNEVLGCANCHLGNPDVTNKKLAHQGMVKNPSNLHWVKKTCGKSSCHPQWAMRVKKSIMTTNSGLVAATLFQWQERPSPNDSTINIAQLPDTSLATSHVRKMCASCHINKPTGDFPGEIGLRGGGCNDCHLIRHKNNKHPTLTVQMGIEVCAKCHNRSNRTALTYQGKFESEGYGTPFVQGGFSEDTLSGNRYYYHIPPDVHFENGLVCIDCHGAEDVMGDGHRYVHLEDQVHVRCQTCHQATFEKVPKNHLVWQVMQSNPLLAVPPDSELAVVGSNIYLTNLRKAGEKVYLIRKLDGRKLLVKQNQKQANCTMPVHERLACQSCHSAYTPQCYGCHDVYDPAKKQFDKVARKETPGHWSEGRSYLRFEEPTLGVDKWNRIVPFAPGCQVYLTVLDRSGRVQKKAQYLTMAPFDPHSTRLKTPSCEDCHFSAKRLGLGKGQFFWYKDSIKVTSVYRADEAGLGPYSLEQMVQLNGKLTQKMSRLKARPFNQKELQKIIGVTFCLTCHDRASDPIYKDFAQSVKTYHVNKNLPCRQID